MRIFPVKPSYLKNYRTNKTTIIPAKPFQTITANMDFKLKRDTTIAMANTKQLFEGHVLDLSFLSTLKSVITINRPFLILLYCPICHKQTVYRLAELPPHQF